MHEGVDCDMCGKKNFEGIRYMCGNCDDYNLCDDCYNKNRDKHNPNHVFIKLNRPIVQETTGTPKALIQLLDPLLYAIPQGKFKEEHLQPIDSKRSYSLTASMSNHATNFERLDYDQNMMLAYSLCKWICTSILFPQDQKCILLKLSMELFICLIKLSNINTLKSLLEDSSSFIQFCMQILYINDPVIISYATEIINCFKSPSGAKQVVDYASDPFPEGMNLMIVSILKGNSTRTRSKLGEGRVF